MRIKEVLTIRMNIPSASTSGRVSTRYKMAKFMKATEDDYSFYVKQYQDIMNDCALRGEDGNIKHDGERVALNPSKVDEYVRRMEELDGQEVECPSITFSVDELEPFDLSVDALLALDPIIVQKEE